MDSFSAEAPPRPFVAKSGIDGSSEALVEGYAARTSATSLSVNRGKVSLMKATKSSSVVMFCATKRGPSFALFWD